MPLTRFLDLEDAMRISVVKKESDVYALDMAGVLGKAAHMRVPPVMRSDPDTCDRLMRGGGLWQVAETVHVTLLVEDITRTLSHQLVRQRVGFTFFQQCTGERDMRHDDYLVDRSMWRCQSSVQLLVFEAKRLYCTLLDLFSVSVQEARHLLPQALATFIYVHANLSSLSEFYKKRCCTMSQAWEMVLLAEGVKKAVLGAYPWATAMFECPCEKGTCWYMRAKDSGFAVTHLFAPDSEHDTFAWNPESFVHGERVHAAVSSGRPLGTVFCSGTRACTEEEYYQAALEYGLIRSIEDGKAEVRGVPERARQES